MGPEHEVREALEVRGVLEVVARVQELARLQSTVVVATLPKQTAEAAKEVVAR